MGSLVTALAVFSNFHYLFAKLPLMPGWASYTFPNVIFAVALKRYSMALDADDTPRFVFENLARVAAVSCTLIVCLVDVNFVRMGRAGALSKPYEVMHVERKPIRFLLAKCAECYSVGAVDAKV